MDNIDCPHCGKTFSDKKCVNKHLTEKQKVKKELDKFCGSDPIEIELIEVECPHCGNPVVVLDVTIKDRETWIPLPLHF